ncbi:MAG: ribonuclease H-like domain-containing protein [Bacillota bacterium]|nr:ribonuclease H-like domain-containing protein [Bacillota bacterium]
MLTLRERLQALKDIQALKPESRPTADESPAVPPRCAQRVDIATVVPRQEAGELETPFGPCFHRVVRYPLAYRRGCHALGEALALPPEVGGRLARPRLAGADLAQAAFLDTETTGLAGGTGTFVFLVGLGHFAGEGEAQEFVLHQFFLRDYSAEPAFLWAVGQELAPFPYLVTFNGRRFDWPLLEARFTVARLRSSLPSPAHLDLLYPSWTLWKRRLGTCRLSHLEEAVLGAPREEDVPGWLIPRLYFAYLRSGDAGPLAPVLRHNLLDILSLVSLTAAVGSRLHAPEGRLPAGDLVAVGHFYERQGEAGVAARCYQEASRDGSCCREALWRLGMLAKRHKEYRLAEEAWTRLAEEFGSIEALVELAKLYEHRYGDPARASEVTELAMRVARCRAERFCQRETEALSALTLRRERLARKLAKKA